MKYLILLIKGIAVFDLCCLAVYLGGDIVSALIRKLRKKPAQSDDLYDFSMDGDTAAPLSIDSIRQLYSGDVETFVEERLLPDAAKTMEALTEREQTAARLLLCALIGYLKEEARMDEQSFPMVMDKKRVILACRILINDLVGKLYRYDYRFGYDLMLTEDNSIEEKLRTSMREEWEDEDYAPCDC